MAPNGATYEQQKRSYELILHKYFTNKFNDTYAVKNISYEPNSNKTSEYTYYPIEIYSSFINIDLKRTIIGGRLSSGGLDYHNFFYYDINTTTNKLDSNLSKDISLDTMISYLCLDELRTDNKTDEEFFNNLNKRNKKLAYSPKELMLQGVKTLLTISPSNSIDTKQREKIYEMYKESVAENKSANATFGIPIDKYNEAMEILEDFKNGNLNTFGSEVDNKSRRLLKALDVIGNNNVKGMYVGCRESWKEKENLEEKNIPPRLIGRLATTIVMEDGLYIG
ncbi:3-deoxy-D-arabinoheptulosonate-7-phosphate synthase [Campylobacter concisus]|uniref:3-deoxy-D-arabinoheptulosonate-7-phosphate synthase n=1 Tax=Campylobacter concisus TaxID=199 RepID=UPI000CD94FC4|nr:3-deoxy-D-arabinoheptulosonate-7-phosphate synthase [Campylobacter concisus]